MLTDLSWFLVTLGQPYESCELWHLFLILIYTLRLYTLVIKICRCSEKACYEKPVQRALRGRSHGMQLLIFDKYF